MTERETNNGFPDKGPQHAILIALFDGRKSGRVVSKDQLKIAVAKEYEDNHVLISDEAIYNYVFRLRKVFKEFVPKYKIRCRVNIGYEIVKDSEINNDF